VQGPLPLPERLVRINRALAALLGLLTIAPHGGIFSFLFVIGPRLDRAVAPSGIASHEFLELHRLAMLVGLSTSMFAFLLLGFYLVFIRQSRRVPVSKKRTWAILIIFGNLLTMPIFWYLYIWKDRPLERRPTLEEYVSGAA
jgi:hypothetical protein